jgi:ribose transport system substrate-binding protein
MARSGASAAVARVTLRAALLLLCLLAPAACDPVAPAASATRVLVLAEDLHNDGVLGVGVGLSEALHELGWQATVVELDGLSQAARAARLAAPDIGRIDGVMLLGMDAAIDNLTLAPFAARRIPIVGWHAGPAPSFTGSPGLAANIATDTDEVARVAAQTVAPRGRDAGLVIFADPRFAISRRKVEIMVETLAGCERCRVLSIEWIAIRDAAAEVPARTRALLAKYGAAWTDTLAINDVYFDVLARVLADEGVPRGRMRNVSAGDGSRSAYDRIRADGYQWATVPEPLLLQGWQLADEMRRLLARLPPARQVAPVVLLTADNAPAAPPASGAWDPPDDYRSRFRSLWQRASAGPEAR